MKPTIFNWIVYSFWLALVVYLSISAIGVKGDTRPHWLQSFTLLFALIAAFWLPQLEIFRFIKFQTVNPWLSCFGVGLTLLGGSILIWGRFSLGKNWSQTVAIKTDHELITSGAYRYVRHPMYSGGIIACIGSALAVGGPFILLLLVLTPLFLWRVGAEDKLMEGQFPAQYPDYKKRTKALIPFVW